MLPDDERHGSYAGAVAHWFDGEKPCDDCATAETRYRKTRKLRALQGYHATTSSVGVLRRIQALQAIGWTGPQIAEAAGVSVHSMRSINYHGSTRVHTSTADKIAATYERLCMTWPEGHYANRARAVARRRGWLPPLAWLDIDDENERPGATWRPQRYSPAELAAEWDHLRRAGVSLESAATQLGITVDAIEKAIERTRKAAA